MFLTSPIAMATAHILNKMRELALLWLTLTLAKKKKERQIMNILQVTVN